MAENLRTTKFNNGSVIPNVINDNQWSGLSTAGMSSLNNNESNDSVYGKYYNGYTLTNNLCPNGWHIPNDQEWTDLELALGMNPSEITLTSNRGANENVGGKLKGVSNFWIPSNLGANNESLFNAIPSGNRASINGSFGNQGSLAYFWTSTVGSDNSRRLNRVLSNSSTGVGVGDAVRRNGFSVRCVRD